MDAAPGVSGDRSVDGAYEAEHLAHLATAARAWLELPTPGQACPSAGCGSSRHLPDEDLEGPKKNAKRQRKLIVFADESGLSEKPSIRRTWGAKGTTPIVVHSQRWSKLSMMAALMYHWSGTPFALTFEIIDGSYDTDRIKRWGRRLVRFLAGRPAILVWDRLAAHKNKAVVAYLKAHRIDIEYLPSYSPHLNPTEWLWANLKGVELANYCPDIISEAAHEARRGIKRIKRRKESLLTGFLHGSGLTLESK